MKVVDINSRRFFGQFYPPARERVPEGLRFWAVTVLAFAAPTLAYCYVTNRTQLLYVAVSLLFFGVLLGTLLYKKRTRNPAFAEQQPDVNCDVKQEADKDQKDAA